ncbi:MAG: aspartate aminotransferase family protein [Gemmatimonadetes bacterium]|nr:aspartate aminotransferase family protein [Gemmatimonadota bacterium]
MSDLGTSLPEIRVPPPGPASRALARRLAAVESRNVTLLSDEFPVFWVEARGANVRDADGNVYVDLSGGFGVAAAGHANERIVGRVREQAGRLIHGMGDVHPPAAKVELLERLCALAPWPDARGVLACTGSEAVEIALKTAKLATRRPGVLAFQGAYHGLSLGALAVTAGAHFRAPFEPWLYQGVEFVRYPAAGGDPDADAVLEQVEERLGRGASNGDPIGAVLVEPIQGRAGVRVPPRGFLAALFECAHEHAALVVADEVFTGFGRTGALFACQAEGVAPDLLCAGKALGGGLPLSVCLGPPEVMDAWPPSSGEAIHTSTFLGHPLACAAALAFLDELEQERLVERAARLGVRLLERLRAGTRGAAVVGEVRGRGLLLGIELVADLRTGAPAAGLAGRVATEALRRGVIVLPAGEAGNVVQLSPPLVITEEQLEEATDVLCEVLASQSA